MDVRRFLAELKRRRVVRAALAYAAVLFVVLQAADILIPALRLPEAVMTGVVVVGLLGFPLAMILAWAVDLTPRGLRATSAAPAGAAAMGEAGPGPAAGGPDPDAAEHATAVTVRTALLLAAAVMIVGASGWWVMRPDPADPGVRALAVLPLANLMGDESQAHFVDGLHDILIGELSHLDDLTVISRTSVLRYRETDLRIGEIADELGVDALLEGSVFRQGDTVRVNVQLIRGRPETHLWEGEYVGRLSQALGLQAQVADAVAGEIRLALSTTTADYLAGRERIEVDPAAQDAYLRAMALWRTRDLERLPRAIPFFEEAVAIDSLFALGWAGVANGYAVAAGYDVLPVSPAEGMAIAERAARKALRLEPGLVEGLAALGAIFVYGRQDFREAERGLSRAIELAPSHAQAHNWLGDALMAQGRMDEALGRYRRATELDPFSALMHRDYARALAAARRCDEAIREAETALDVDPLHFFALEVLRSCALRAGESDDAARLTIEIAEHIGDRKATDSVRIAYETGGISAVLRSDARAFERAGLHVLAAIRWAEAGRTEEAFAALDRSLDTRQALLILVRTEPAFAPIYDDPRWNGIIERLDALADATPAD